MKLCTRTLHRLMGNAKLFQVGKEAQPALFKFSGGKIVMSITDGHTYIEDKDVMEDEGADFTLSVPPGTVKVLELALRDVTADTAVLGYSDGAAWLNGAGVGDCLAVDAVENNILDMSKFRDSEPPVVFELWGDKLARLRLIKPGDYPLSFIMGFHQELKRDLLLFKAGPTVEGALSLVDRDFLTEGVDSERYLW